MAKFSFERFPYCLASNPKIVHYALISLSVWITQILVVRTVTFQDNVDLDDLLPHIGEFGKYQKIMLWLVCLPACFPCGFCAFNQLFMADVPDHWCKVPELSEFSAETRKELAIPKEDAGAYSKCSRYKVNWTLLMEEYDDDTLEIIISVENYTRSWKIESCLDGWDYNVTEIVSSIVIDFDLVCDKAIYPTIGLAALNLGGPVGVYLFGLLNDGKGRRISFFTCLATLIFGSALTATAQNFWWWAVSRIVVGLTIPAIYQIPFIISLELVGPNYRSFVTVMTCMFYTFGLMMLALVTYLVRDWIHLTLATSAPFLLYTLYWFFLPESPRWLLAKGRLEEASKVLESLARVNGKEMPVSFKQKLKQKMMLHRTKSEEARMSKGHGIGSLLGTPNMRLKTILITLNWFANETVYVGLSYYGPALGNNQYISFFLSSAVEIPSYFACLCIMDKWGRRWPLCLCMIISGVSCIATVLLPSDAVTATLVLFLISKSAISASFLIIYPFAGELYPTQLRGLGIGASAYIGGLGLIIIPFITYLGSENLVLPLIIMGVVSVLGGISGLRLPETLHHRLPQTVEEGEEFGKNFSMEDFCRCIPIKPNVSHEGSSENIELDSMKMFSEEIPEEPIRPKRLTMKRLARQQSFMDTQKHPDGTMQMTYWF